MLRPLQWRVRQFNFHVLSISTRFSTMRRLFKRASGRFFTSVSRVNCGLGALSALINHVITLRLESELIS